VVKAAEGAALGTETTMTYEVMHGNYSLLPNKTLQELVHSKLVSFGGIEYTEQEQTYAENLADTLPVGKTLIGEQENVMPFVTSHSYGSTDVGDVSWNVPTAGFRTASWVPGTSAHSWQAVAAGGTSIGLKGAELAAKVLSSSAIELYVNKNIIDMAKKEYSERVGSDFRYEPLLGDRKPPLDYRVN
jgi:aminobenzoyl-glutamate utilization protein B